MAKSKWFEDVQLFRMKREQLGVTQHQLAKMSKVGYAVIASIEAERRKLTNDEVGNALWRALADVEIERRKQRMKSPLNLLLGPKDSTPQARREWEAEFAKLQARAVGLKEAQDLDRQLDEELPALRTEKAQLMRLLDEAIQRIDYLEAENAELKKQCSELRDQLEKVQEPVK